MTNSRTHDTKKLQMALARQNIELEILKGRLAYYKADYHSHSKHFDKGYSEENDQAEIKSHLSDPMPF